jgi:predicted SAM-dependent methyltransferase
MCAKINNKKIFPKLNMGCGLNAPKDWINLDASWNAWLAKSPLLLKLLKLTNLLPEKLLEIGWPTNVVIHDVRKPLPFKSNSFEAVYSSHLLEHLYLNEAEELLKECFRILCPGGIIRIVVPDFKYVLEEYGKGLNRKQSPRDLADNISRKIFIWEQKPHSRNIICKIYDSMKDFHSHKWMYDANSLINHLERAGFKNAKEMKANQSKIKDIEKVERADRIANGAGICIEAIKPNN